MGDQLPAPQLENANSISAYSTMPPAPPSSIEESNRVEEADGHDGVTDLDSVASPLKETESVFLIKSESPVNMPVESSVTDNVSAAYQELAQPSIASDNNGVSSQGSARSNKIPMTNKNNASSVKKSMKKAGFIPQVLHDSQQELDNTIVSVDESDNF